MAVSAGQNKSTLGTPVGWIWSGSFSLYLACLPGEWVVHSKLRVSYLLIKFVHRVSISPGKEVVLEIISCSLGLCALV